MYVIIEKFPKCNLLTDETGEVMEFETKDTARKVAAKECHDAVIVPLHDETNELFSPDKANITRIAIKLSRAIEDLDVSDNFRDFFCDLTIEYPEANRNVLAYISTFLNLAYSMVSRENYDVLKNVTDAYISENQ